MVKKHLTNNTKKLSVTLKLLPFLTLNVTRSLIAHISPDNIVMNCVLWYRPRAEKKPCTEKEIGDAQAQQESVVESSKLLRTIAAQNTDHNIYRTDNRKRG